NRGWKGTTGRVNLIVEECLEDFGLSKEDTLVYACGHPGMIEDVKARLVPKGFRVKEERFWKQ
ncbi:MAG: ferredoxin--NADP reductase, partial [Chloroflexi bacterium]|nr:ferredoxin--NADP reductase [Chloroflexota bacterium]